MGRHNNRKWNATRVLQEDLWWYKTNPDPGSHLIWQKQQEIINSNVQVEDYDYLSIGYPEPSISPSELALYLPLNFEEINEE